MSVADLTSGKLYATLTEAIIASAANDIIQIFAGSYVENFPDIAHNLTIEAAGWLAYLSNPQPDPPNGRAVINVPSNLNVSLTLSGLDISGAVDDASNPPDQGGANGAGILFEIGNGTLDVENCHIHNNDDRILTGGLDLDYEGFPDGRDGFTVRHLCANRNSQLSHVFGLGPSSARAATRGHLPNAQGVAVDWENCPGKVSEVALETFGRSSYLRLRWSLFCASGAVGSSYG